ncbi:MAG TPA: two-component regulator propeller domain-containing protein [Prolixibacteraceae bacterium]|nr:two-component regulator propeller domain-containing protein [Prolixibacteraceae bacterium]
MKSQLQIFVLVLFFLLIRTVPTNGQQITFHKLLPPDGLDFEFVTRITQDINGIMWYSTKKGLYRYDGNQLSSYKNNPLNPNSILSNFLETIYADFNGNIWIGSLGKGLDRFDPQSGTFTHFQHDPNNPASLSNDTVTAILRDKQGTLWIGTHGGLDQFDPQTNQFIHYRYKKNDTTSLSNNQVRVIYEDRHGTLWIGTGSPFPDNGGRPEDGGLNKLDKETGTFTRYLHDPIDPESLISNKVSAIFEDHQGVLWIGTALNGLHQMNRQQGTFERLVFDPDHPEKLSGPALNSETTTFEHITFFTQDAAGSYWFGTVDAGLYYFNPQIGKITHFHGSDNSTSGFTDNGAWKAFTSRDGVLWIGGTQGNIYHIDPLHQKIPHTLVAGAPVHHFYEEPNGVFWIGTNRELIRNDKANEITKQYLVNTNPSQKIQNTIFRIKPDRQGNLWAGNNFGLHLWDKGKEKFISFKNDPQDSNTLSNNNVIEIYEDRKANFWIGTLRGFNLMDRKTGRFTRYFLNPADTSSFGQNIITSILEDKTGDLWVASWNLVGINLFNHQTKTFKTYLKGSSMMCLYEDTDGVLWAGGNDGLYKFNREVNNFIRYTDIGNPSGLTDVVSIVEDNQKQLWIGSSLGIVRLNPQRNETSTLGLNYGISENTLIFGSSYKGLNGDLYFGDTTGYFSFSPVEFTKNLKAPEIVFTAFRLADHTIKPGEGPVKGKLSEQTQIVLKYDQDIFSFDFAAIDYANPKENRLIYYLENYDNSWHPTSSEQRAYYFNVPPGKYTFRVKAVNSYGGWAEKKMEVIILPPWWRTWWAYTLYGLLFVAAVFGFDRFRRQRLLQAERERNRERELAHAKEIEKAYTELKATQVQLIQSEKMASLGELTAGIAHEIQNPLNFVNNFSEVNKELLGELNQEIDKGRDKIGMEEIKALVTNVIANEEKIMHHGQRADAIVKGMLQHSRTSSGMKEPTDINALADEYLRLAYHGHRAKDKSFNASLNTHYDAAIGTINIIPQEIGRVILNLITNAFYAVTEKKQKSIPDYQPTITVITKKMGNKVLITVKDNGNGIPPHILDKIFQPFFTTKPSGKGTGLGLSLAYDIIKAHGGEIKVETMEGQSTEFIVDLPVK